MTTPRAVVTGGAGFLGSHLCERLLEQDYEVLCVDNFCTGTPANVAHLLDHPRFRLLRRDVTDYLHVSGPVTAVLHFASPASPIDYLQLPIETLKVGQSAPCTRSVWPRTRARGSCWRRPRSATAIRRCIRSQRPTGGTSTRSARAGCTTRRSASARHLPWPTGAATAWTPRSCGSSTRSGRGCARTTAGRSPPSSARRWPASR